MKNSTIDKAISEEVIRRSKYLMRFNLEEIKNLPPESAEDIKIGSKTLTICTYKDELPNGEILVIVQCKNTIFLSYGNMFAEGFVASESGQKRKAEESLMWEYM